MNDEFDDDDDDAFDDIDASDDDDATVACPYCGRDVYDDAERCPHCEQYISDVDAPAGRRPWWLLIGLALCLYAVYRWVVG